MKTSLKTVVITAGLLVACQSYGMGQDDKGFFKKFLGKFASDAKTNLNAELESALRRKDIEAVNNAIEQGADINCIYDGGLTPISIAAELGDCQSVALLLNSGAHYNVGITSPLSMAIKYEQGDVIDLLIKYDVEKAIKHSNNHFGLHLPIDLTDEKKVRWFIDSGFNLNGLYKDRAKYRRAAKYCIAEKPLMLSKNKNIIKMLLLAGANDKTVIKALEGQIELTLGSSNLFNGTEQELIRKTKEEADFCRKNQIAMIKEAAQEIAFEKMLPQFRTLKLVLKHTNHGLKNQNDMHNRILQYVAGDYDLAGRIKAMPAVKQ